MSTTHPGAATYDSPEVLRVTGTESDILFGAAVAEDVQEISLEERSRVFIHKFPVLFAKLTCLEGVKSLPREDRRIIQRGEYELFLYLAELEDTGLTDEVIAWRVSPYPPMEPDFIQEEHRAIRDFMGQSRLLDILLRVMPIQNDLFVSRGNSPGYGEQVVGVSKDYL